MLTDALPQSPHFFDQVVARHLKNVFVHSLPPRKIPRRSAVVMCGRQCQSGYVLQVRRTKPDSNGLAPRNFNACRSLTSLNSAFPPPRTMGYTTSRSSSITPWFLRMPPTVG